MVHSTFEDESFLDVPSRTYHWLFFPSLDVLSLGFGEMVPDLLVTGGHEQPLNLTDYQAHANIYTIKPNVMIRKWFAAVCASLGMSSQHHTIPQRSSGYFTHFIYTITKRFCFAITISMYIFYIYMYIFQHFLPFLVQLQDNHQNFQSQNVLNNNY